MLVRSQAETVFSAMILWSNVVIFENTRVFDTPLLLSPSSSSVKLVGDKLGLVVKLKSWASFGTASFTTVIWPGTITASVDRDRSWLPPWPSMSRKRMWYDDPLMVPAELPSPQSCWVAMWPPQASTGFVAVAVNVMVMLVWLLPAYDPESV